MSRARKPRIYYARTEDGWRIALHRHRGTQFRYPVLLVHGLASNYTKMDFPLEELSLARFLKNEGFDTWVVDLRGSGLSKRKSLRPQSWYFDDYVFKDLPASIEKILQITKAKQVHWLGHSLGGLLAYPFCQIDGRAKQIRSLTTLACPMATRSKVGYFKYLYRLDAVIRFLPAVPYRSLSKLASYFPRGLLRFDDHVLYSRENMSEEILQKAMVHAVENVPSSLIRQIHGWFRNNNFASRNGEIDFMENLDKVSMPILMLTGSIDTFTPMKDMRWAFRQLPNADKTLKIFGKKHGQKNEYGHIDLLLGKNAPKEIFPVIAKWLAKHDKRTRSTSRSG